MTAVTVEKGEFVGRLFLSTFYWPCRVSSDGNGEYCVSPLATAGCDGTGSSLEEAIEAARQALLDYLKAKSGELVVPPAVALDAVELQRGEVMRVEVNLSI